MLSKVKQKTCTICEQSKPRNAFPRHVTKSHKMEYCSSCQEAQGEKVFLFSASNFAIDMISMDYADSLLLAGIVEYKKEKYYLLADEKSYRKEIKFIYPKVDTTSFMLAIGKYDEKRKRVSVEKASQLVEEEACKWEGDHLRHLYAGKELAEFVLQRDKAICYYCNGVADRITFLIPRSQGGHLSPKNSVSACRSCKDIHGENLYFFKWVNVPVLSDENRTNTEIVCTMWDKEKQTQFCIKESDACTLLNEQMATKISERTIHIPYNQKEFWDYIRKRDDWTCHYCGKHGDTVDHITPKSKGGMSTPVNCVCACSKCNEKKSSQEKDKFIEKRKNR